MLQWGGEVSDLTFLCLHSQKLQQKISQGTLGCKSSTCRMSEAGCIWKILQQHVASGKKAEEQTGLRREAVISIYSCQGSTDLSSVGSSLWEVLQKEKLDERYMEEEKQKFCFLCKEEFQPILRWHQQGMNYLVLALCSNSLLRERTSCLQDQC